MSSTAIFFECLLCVRQGKRYINGLGPNVFWEWNILKLCANQTLAAHHTPALPAIWEIPFLTTKKDRNPFRFSNTQVRSEWAYAWRGRGFRIARGGTFTPLLRVRMNGAPRAGVNREICPGRLNGYWWAGHGPLQPGSWQRPESRGLPVATSLFVPFVLSFVPESLRLPPFNILDWGEAIPIRSLLALCCQVFRKHISMVFAFRKDTSVYKKALWFHLILFVVVKKQ